MTGGWTAAAAAAALAISGCASGPPQAASQVASQAASPAALPALPPSVQGAAANYPPLILGANVHPTDGREPPRPCPAPGSQVALKGGPVMAWGGADPSDPDLCLFTADGQPVQAWFGIWQADWGGAEGGRAALKRTMTAPSGAVAGFDTDMGRGRRYHDLLRNEGVEDILLLGHAYRALKISHYREGFDGNDYRSVSTVWKDIPTGLLIYGTYQHIAGRPEIDDPLIPTAIVTPPGDHR